ncbi:MAG: PhoX family phosphatase [Phycisphaerae bacterium]
MSLTTLNRRSFLKYVGYGAAAFATGPALGPLARAAAAASPALPAAWMKPDGTPAFSPVPYPVPLPNDPGDAAADKRRLAKFEVVDDVVLPEGFRYDVLARFADRFGPEGRVRFGFNADYTGLVPFPGREGEHLLIVNHEYISARPWLQAAQEDGEPLADAQGRIAGVPLADLSIDLLNPGDTDPKLLAGVRKLCERAMADLGVTVLHVKRTADGGMAVIQDSDKHFRVHGSGHVNAAGMAFTGPAAEMLGQPRGTYSNCSGGTTPWGTFLTCEENFQNQVVDAITPAGQILPGDVRPFSGSTEPDARLPLPFEFDGLGTGLDEPLDGRQYGWVAEVNPVARTLKKHTLLGRFRHENVAVRAEAGKPLAAYMGDDRRGGHVWKFVSKEVVKDPADPANSKLFEAGTLYVARFDEDYTGQWVPLSPETPLARPEPQTTSVGSLRLPARPFGGEVVVATPALIEKARQRLKEDGKDPESHGLLTADAWVKQVEAYNWYQAFATMTLEDLVDPRRLPPKQRREFIHAVLMMDAFSMANAAGGTPTARPEDVEVHPIDGSVYIAFTDSTGSGDGSPDARIFPDSAGTNSRQYGAIYRIAETDNEPAATTFGWGKFVASGEAADGGGGFACADNLVFDPAGNLWMVTDISTLKQNFPVNRTDNKTAPGEGNFPGVFGNNAMFVFPTTGEHAGNPFCFATGPVDCEFCGPTFTDDAKALILAVQHPGEAGGTRGGMDEQQPQAEERAVTIATRKGETFQQQRTVPLGSRFAAKPAGRVPRPSVIVVRQA